MDVQTTPGPVGSSPVTEFVTETVTKGIAAADGDFAAVIGGIVAAVLFLLICTIAVLLWCLSRQKGSYVTNEMDEDDDVDNVDDNDDNESVGSDTALQDKEPLETKEVE